MPSSSADVLVLGGGAAGLFAAMEARRRGASVLLLEKNSKPGVKILASGGSRCNLTTTRTGLALERSFPEEQQSFLRFALRALPPDRLRKWFEFAGVETVEEEYEKVFPSAGRASVVLEALLAEAEELGVEILGESPAMELRRNEDGFVVTTPTGSIQGRRAILATGGKSYPKAGTTGDGYTLAKALGHSVTALRPGLVGLRAKTPELSALSGITIEDASVRLVDRDRELARSDRPVLFTHEGVSGPGPMNVARAVPEAGAVLLVDSLATMRADDLELKLSDAARQQGSRRIANLLPASLPERLREVCLRQAGIPFAAVGHELSRERRHALVLALKGLRVPIAETLGFGRAEVTIGGVSLDEVDPRSMHSKIAPGLYVVGEVLNVDGPIGGFNFQAAFATGFVGGQAAGSL